MAATVHGIPYTASGQQQQLRFTFDLDTSHADPYERDFVFSFRKTDGWNVIPLEDVMLPSSSILLIERVEVTSAVACGLPFVVMHDDGRLVGQPRTILRDIDLPSPPSFPAWAKWATHVHGVCGLGGIDRKKATGHVEALNEERFFLSELYMALPQLIRTQEEDGSQYRLRMWQSLISAHIPPTILKSIRYGSVSQCLKQHYLQCPLIKTRLDRPFADLCIHVCPGEKDDTDRVMRVAVTVSGKRISHVCTPLNVMPSTNGQASFETFADHFIHPAENGIEFEEIFRRFPIRFHRDRFALR